MTQTQITVEQWREKLEDQHRFRSFFSSVSQIKVAKTADPKLVKMLVEASERVR